MIKKGKDMNQETQEAELSPIDESPTDAEIVQVVADKFDMSYADAVARVAAIDFELLALVA